MTEPGVDVLVFDTGPLHHFALADWLGVLKAVVGSRQAVVPDVVVDELRRSGARHPRLAHLAVLPWVRHQALDSDEEIEAFARYSSLLVKGDRNLGEAAVLALAETAGAYAVIDDAAGRKAARSNGVLLKPTLALLCEAVRGELLTVPLVSAVADDLLATEYRLPLLPGRFADFWASHPELH